MWDRNRKTEPKSKGMDEDDSSLLSSGDWNPQKKNVVKNKIRDALKNIYWNLYILRYCVVKKLKSKVIF